MCGISGVWYGQKLEKPSSTSLYSQQVASMMQHLVHRGPDASGMYHSAHGVLGHRRLAIMDPEEGHQPYKTDNDSVSLVANGEIYNWRSLRERTAHYPFCTQADTEVAVPLFRQQGAQAAAMLDGMFALAYSRGDELLLARDPIGIKPLYYSRQQDAHGERLYFASEMKALLELNSPIATLEPGSTYSSRNGQQRYYRVPSYPEREPMDAAQAISEVRSTLERAVHKRLMSDVPLGAFLSGGLDSSIIAAIAKAHMGELHTFSVGMEGAPDLEAARRVAAHLDTIHHEYIFSQDEVRQALPEVMYALESFDQDLVRSVIPTYFTSRLAAEHVKVILTGEGADELFAGYSYYRNYRDPEALQRELHRSITSMHNVNLQRVDRITMAHSIEGRVPFLDLEMIDLAARIPPQLKLYQDGSKQIEKWVLRKAFEDMLPSDIVWRDKAQFDEGSGTVDMLEHFIHEATHDKDSQAFRQARPHAKLRSKEEAYYYSIFEDVFDKPELMLENIGRWAQ